MTSTTSKEHQTILNLMARPFDSLNMTQGRLCGLFVFIDHLMCKYQKTPVYKDKQLKIIDTLLQSGPRMHVAIHHAKKEEIPVFLEKMLSNANQIENEPDTHQPIIQKCAKRFKETFQAFFGLIKKKISNLLSSCSLPELWDQLDAQKEIRNFATTFINSLVNFTYLYYQETIGRLLKLNTHQVEGRLQYAQCVCAKAIV
jgi:hypothetical protein